MYSEDRPASSLQCTGSSTPAGYSVNNTDCNDNDATKTTTFP